MRHALRFVALLVATLGAGAATSLTGCTSADATPSVAFTVGDVYAVHADVTVSEQQVPGEGRLSDGDTLRTGPDGRARVRLDDGTIIAVDADTSFALRGNRLELSAGRVFVSGGKVARTEVRLGSVSTTVSASAAAFEASSSVSRIYCAQGELLIQGDKQTRVASGETARLVDGSLSVAPEKAFDDWTGGLAVPWTTALGDKSTIPEVRGLSEGADPGAPLVIRSHTLEVRLEGEVALTKSRTRYFNGSASAAHARVRLALPDGAILARVARYDGNATTEARVGIAAGASRLEEGAWTGLEWAGGGWLSGDLGGVEAGQTLDLELEYVEWLATRAGRAAYRFAMAGGDEPALVGELSADIHTATTPSPFVAVSAGATVTATDVHYRRADVRPVGDIVVELAPSWSSDGVARAYVAPGERGEDPYVMVRTELPDRGETGVTLAVVVDASMSVGNAALETERAVLDAVLEGLGPRDALVVLAADQSVRALGPATPTAVTPALRADVRQALGALRAGGASNLGAALTQAADILDAPSRGESAGLGMVLYVGDGRPSVGDPDATSIRRSLGRRTGGLPRLSAIAVGPTADRWTLARLVSGVGTVYEVADRADAARAGVALLSDALRPTLRDVAIDLGPTIDRVYPRDARALANGSTVTVLGRLRGKLPTHVGFRFRDGNRTIDTSRPLHSLALPRAEDVARRWAAARIEELAARDDGIEPVIALAARARLLTPWTSWFFEAPPSGSGSRPLPERVLVLLPASDTAFAARIDDLGLAGSTLLEPPHRVDDHVSLQQAAQVAVRRILTQATSLVRACRDARASVRPDLGRIFSLDLSVDAAGQATRVRVLLTGGAGPDRVLERCIEGVVQSLPYVAAGVAVQLTHTLEVPESRSASRTQCSDVSRVALPLRKIIWRARGALGTDAFLLAARGCELPRWADQRAFLLLALEQPADGWTRLRFARELEGAGEADAASFVRREVLRRVTSFEELQALTQQLTADEPRIDTELDRAYEKATTDTDRLTVVRRFLRLAPHNHRARQRLLALLEALGDRRALFSEIDALRNETFVDAGLLAQGASALRRLGFDDEGRRVFGELIERAPNDPWTLAYVGDRLRAEGMFDEAGAAYASLGRALPDDAAVTLRLALAHAGAGRLDVATRLLDRVAQTGGRGDDGQLGELASITEAVLLAGALGNQDPDVAAEVERRLASLALPDVHSVVLVQSHPADDPLLVSVTRERGEKERQSADLDARVLGLSALRIERGDGATRILLERTREPGPARATKATVFALVLGTDRGPPRLLKRELEVFADGKPVELRFDGEAFL